MIFYGLVRQANIVKLCTENWREKKEVKPTEAQKWAECLTALSAVKNQMAKRTFVDFIASSVDTYRSGK